MGTLMTRLPHVFDYDLTIEALLCMSMTETDAAKRTNMAHLVAALQDGRTAHLQEHHLPLDPDEETAS